MQLPSLPPRLLGAVPLAATLCLMLSAQADITSGLVMHYRFDESSGTTASDSSGSGNQATLINFPDDGTPYWVAGRIGGALEFCADGGDDDQVVTDNPVTLANQNTFTFAFWAKRKSDNNPFNPRLMGPVRETDGQYWVLWAPGTGVGFYPPAKSAEPIRDVWQHFVVTYNRPAGSYTLYVDGVKKASRTDAGYVKNPAGDSQWVIGHKELLADNRDPWRGYLDDVRAYNRILTDADVMELYSQAPPLPPTVVLQPKGGTFYVNETIQLSVVIDGTPPITYKWKKDGTAIAGATNDTLTLVGLQTTDTGTYSVTVGNVGGDTASQPASVTVKPVTDITTGLDGYWKFDDTTGAVAKDSSSGAHDGEVFPGDGQWTTGRVGGALAFRGAGNGDDYVVVPDFPRATNGTMTVAAWVFAEARPDRARIACGASGADGVGQFLLTQSTGGSDLRGYVGATGGARDAREGTAFPTNSWQHVVMVADGATMSVYRNGSLAAVTNYNGSIGLTTGALSIGVRLTADDSAAESGWWQGKIDDLAYWRRGLTANEVVSLFAAGTAGKDVTQAGQYASVGPVITEQPQGVSILAGEPLALRVYATGTGALSYQWKKNGAFILNATNALYAVPVAEAADQGDYSVTVTNAIGSATSDAAHVAVSDPPVDLSTRLVLHLGFDETSGTVAKDSSGRGNDASLVNFADGSTPWVPGIIGNAIQMNTKTNDAGLYTDQVLTDNAINLDNQDAFTFALWAKALSPYGALLNPRFISPWQVTHWILWRGGVGVGIWDNVPSTLQPTDAWHHFAVVYDRASQIYSVYVDGTLVAHNLTVTAPKTEPGSVQWTIGYPENVVNYIGDEWHGALDDLRMYNRLLNPKDVLALYRLGQPPAVTLSVSGSASQVIVSWPAEVTGYVLEETSELTATTWTATGGVSANRLTLSPAGSQKFYRLRKL